MPSPSGGLRHRRWCWSPTSWLTDRFTEATRNRAELRLALYSGNILTELQRNSVVPLLLASDPELIGALNSGDFSQTSQRLISFQSEIGAASILLLDMDGRAVAATNRHRMGTNLRAEPFFVEAQRSKDTVFSPRPGPTAAAIGFTYSRALVSENQVLGVIVVEVDLMKYERAWAGLQDAVLVTDSEGTVMLATEPRWRGLPWRRRWRVAQRLGHRAGASGDGGLGASPAGCLCEGRGGDADETRIAVPGLADGDLHRLRIRCASG